MFWWGGFLLKVLFFHFQIYLLCVWEKLLYPSPKKERKEEVASLESSHSIMCLDWIIFCLAKRRIALDIVQCYVSEHQPLYIWHRSRENIKAFLSNRVANILLLCVLTRCILLKVQFFLLPKYFVCLRETVRLTVYFLLNGL